MESMHRLADLLRGAERLRYQRRVDDSRADAVHPDARRREFKRRISCQANHCVLRGVVGRESDAAANAGHRCGVYDRAAFLRDHHFAAELEAPEHAVEIYAKSIRVKLFGGIEKRRDDTYSGVVEHDVEAAELVARGGHQLLD